MSRIISILGGFASVLRLVIALVVEIIIFGEVGAYLWTLLHWAEGFHVIWCQCCWSTILSNLPSYWHSPSRLHRTMAIPGRVWSSVLTSLAMVCSHMEDFPSVICHLISPLEFLSTSVQSFNIFSPVLHWLVNAVKVFLAEDCLLQDSPPDFLLAANSFVPSEQIFEIDIFRPTLTCVVDSTFDFGFHSATAAWK